LDIVVCWARSRGRVVAWSLLLLLLLQPLLVLLGTSSPGSWSELILVLSECVVEPVWVRDASPGPDEFNHLSTFSDVDGFHFVFAVVLREGVSDGFFQDAQGKSIEEEAYGFFVSNSISGLSYQVFEVGDVLVNIQEAHLALVKVESSSLL
jgi:hypothetical protein